MPSPHDADAGRRAAILVAASALFATQGYAATSMSDIRRASGASTGSLYHHFPSREHVAAAVWRDTLASFQAAFGAALAGPAPARRGLVQSVHAHAAWVEDHPDRARFLAAGREPGVVALTADEDARVNEAFFAALASWYRGHVAAGALRRVSWPVLLALWVGPTQEVASAWLEGRGGPSPRSVADEVGTALWRTLRAG